MKGMTSDVEIETGEEEEEENDMRKRRKMTVICTHRHWFIIRIRKVKLVIFAYFFETVLD